MRGTCTTALVAALLGGTSAIAQTVQPAPVRQSVDGNGVDLFHGVLNISRQDASIGATGGLSYSRYWRDQVGTNSGAWVDNFDIHLYQANTNTVTVTMGGNAENFTGTGTYTNAQGGGSTLIRSGSNSAYTYTYTDANGTVYTFSQVRGYTIVSAGDIARIVKIVSPEGETQSFEYTEVVSSGSTYSRLASVTTNFGYKIMWSYVASTPQGTGGVNAFYTVAGVTLSNFSSTTSIQSASYNSNAGAIDSAGRSWAYQLTGNKITGVQRPGHSMDIAIAYHSGNGRVHTYKDPTNVVTSYNYSDANGERTTTIKIEDGSSSPSFAVFDINTALMKRSIDELGHVTNYEYYSSGLLKKVAAPDGNSVEYEYDGRGNRTKTIAHPKPGAKFSNGAPMTDVVTMTAKFPNTCANPKTCNKPEWTKDGRSTSPTDTTYQTDYTYEPLTGMTETITPPAGANGIRPQVRYGFVALPTSWGAGGYIRQVKSVTTCRIELTCAGTADETVTEFDYENDASNLVLKSVKTHSGDGSLQTETHYGYDGVRNVNRVTDGLGKSTIFHFLAGREQLWAFGPDPDDWGPGNNGPLKNRMVVTDRYPDGSVLAVKTGTGNADASGFVELQRTQYGYDAAGRKIWEIVDVAGARTSQTEYSYDSHGRLDCTNQRMNFNNMVNVFGNTHVCDLSAAGSWGQDRITRTEYDAASRVTRTWAGYRTANAYKTDYNWTNNNKLERIIDPKLQATTYFYDGFDRLRYTCFVTTSCGNAPIFEELAYDNNENVTIRRQRDGSLLTYTYDALNRISESTAITLDNQTDRVTRYTYDNQGRVTKAAVDNYPYLDVRYTYDALGRLTQESSDVGMLTVGYGYDAANRMNYLGYGDGYFVNYDYYNTGEMRQVRENGAVSGSGVLADIGIDNLGRRVSLSRGDGSSESRIYSQSGNGPWMTQLTQNMGGGGAFSRSFSYSPVSQILSRDSGHNGYAWTQTGNVDRSYDVNGLNQYTRSGSVPANNSIYMSYDGRGNLISAPSPLTDSNGNPGNSSSFAYNTQNMLVGVNGVGFAYDAIGRLSIDGTPASAQKFGYAGSRLLTERAQSNGSFLYRYVYGPDEAPLVMYEGSGTGTKRYLVPDERGSIVARTDGAGNFLNANVYDEFGIPASNNKGRFGYTGQAWNSTMGMWYYKARIYSPNLGRFMQTDPIGYADGLNMYNYVGGDPVNATDPSGLESYTPGLAPNYALTSTVNTNQADGSQGDGSGANIVGAVYGLGKAAFCGIFGCKKKKPKQMITMPQNMMQPVSCVQDNKAFHDQQVAAAAKTFQSQGYQIIPNVSFRLLVASANGQAQLGPRAVADFVAVRNGGTLPGDRFIFEMKTGGGDFSPNQSQVYPLNGPTVAVPVGANAAAAGFDVGQPILVTPNTLKVQRCPK